MFELTKGEMKILFEYDNIEELRETLDALEKKLFQVENINPSRYCSFQELETHFIAHKRKLEKVGDSSFRMYLATFNKLKDFFQDKSICELRYQDVEDFQQYLKSKKIGNTTINNHLTYFKMFMDLAVKKEIIEKNIVIGFDTLKQVKPKKENFIDEEIGVLINYKWDDYVYNQIFKILALTGMRIHEVLSISQNDIKTDEKGIVYIDLPKSKTENGYRKIPLHKDFPTVIFPLFIKPEKQNFIDFTDSIGRRINRRIHQVIKDKGKTCHTFRGTFIQKLSNLFPEKINIVQEIVGHSKGSKSLTLDTYSKEFYLETKKEMIDKVSYKDLIFKR
ncbi:MAG: phage integrase SAM-like domain-containing protein [Sulfurospirillaceae bacterium]|nr:phage integrase SAM-like domain-containing protein [Sulfurospirillaceae bacterium]